MKDRITDLNARSGTIPILLLKAFLAFFLGAIVMALLVPLVHSRGWELRGWMVWAVILGSFALCLGPDLWIRWRRRGRRSGP